MFWNWFLSPWGFICAIFSFSVMIDLVFYLSILFRKFRKKFILWFFYVNIFFFHIKKIDDCHLEFLTAVYYGFFPTNDMQTFPPFPSEGAIFTWNMHTVLNRMKNKFSDFYFLIYGWLYLQLCQPCLIVKHYVRPP